MYFIYAIAQPKLPLTQIVHVFHLDYIKTLLKRESIEHGVLERRNVASAANSAGIMNYLDPAPVASLVRGPVPSLAFQHFQMLLEGAIIHILERARTRSNDLDGAVVENLAAAAQNARPGGADYKTPLLRIAQSLGFEFLRYWSAGDWELVQQLNAVEVDAAIRHNVLPAPSRLHPDSQSATHVRSNDKCKDDVTSKHTQEDSDHDEESDAKHTLVDESGQTAMAMVSCASSGCTEEALSEALQMCPRHAIEYSNNVLDSQTKATATATCVAPGCIAPVFAATVRLCRDHNAKRVTDLRKELEEDDGRRVPPEAVRGATVCITDGCTHKVYIIRWGLCKKCYGNAQGKRERARRSKAAALGAPCCGRLDVQMSNTDACGSCKRCNIGKCTRCGLTEVRLHGPKDQKDQCFPCTQRPPDLAVAPAADKEGARCTVPGCRATALNSKVGTCAWHTNKHLDLVLARIEKDAWPKAMEAAQQFAGATECIDPDCSSKRDIRGSRKSCGLISHQTFLLCAACKRRRWADMVTLAASITGATCCGRIDVVMANKGECVSCQMEKTYPKGLCRGEGCTREGPVPIFDTTLGLCGTCHKKKRCNITMGACVECSETRATLIEGRCKGCRTSGKCIKCGEVRGHLDNDFVCQNCRSTGPCINCGTIRNRLNTSGICDVCTYQCSDLGCTKMAQNSPRGTGKKGKCTRHGGFDRCEHICCTPLNPRSVATRYYPSGPPSSCPELAPFYDERLKGIGLCSYGARMIVTAAREAGHIAFADAIQDQLGIAQQLFYRIEHAFLWALNLLLIEGFKDREISKAFFDTPCGAIAGVPKTIHDKRPDYFWRFREGADTIGIWGEFDETGWHEECSDRIRGVARHIGIPIERIYVFRVKAYANSRKLRLFQVARGTDNCFELTQAGEEAVVRVAVYANECATRAMQGIPPDVSAGEISITIFD